MNKGQRLSFSFPDLWYSLLEFNSRKICQHLTNWTSWNKRDKVWSSANSLFKGRFCSRRRREREGKKAIAGGLDWQNNKFSRASRSFVHFFALVATWKCLNLRFCRGHQEHKTTTFFFSSWTLIQSFRIQLQKRFSNIWRGKRDGMSEIKFRATRLHFLSDVFVAVAVVCCLSSLLL